MTDVGSRDSDNSGLVNNLRSLIKELATLHGELYWLALQPQDSVVKDAKAAELDIELLTDLKGAVDNMRLLLWNYIETAWKVDAGRVREGLEAQRVQRVTHFLELLRERLGPNPEEEPISFIERISAAVGERLGDKVA